MTPQILRACIVGNYVDLFDDLLMTATPDAALALEAEKNANPHYKEALASRAKELGVTPSLKSYEQWKMDTERSLAMSTTSLPRHMDVGLVGTGFNSLYDELQCDISQIELLACLPEEWKVPADELGHMELDYVEWPPHGVGGSS
jgi:hypothetical protein